jgi:hypothetical protein
MKQSIERLNRLLDSNLSIIPIGDNKKPTIAWKQYQTEKITKDLLIDNYQSAKGFGIITGFNNLEVIDIDCKVLSSLKEQNDFWNEFLSFLKDNIDDFDKKFVIYKTINKGYHIIYRCKTITNNKKIAKLKDHPEALIESRGIGGYVFIYDNQISELSYTDIQEIEEQDRNILWDICKTYNYNETELKPSDKEVKDYKDQELTTWDDFNNKTSIFDIISNDFEIVRNINDRYIIKRFGSKSIHSGYVYKNSGCMFLFSTGTIYPNEKLISPFAAYAIKNHNGDFKAAASDLYKKGFGSRIVKEIELKEKPEINNQDLIFPIDIFPEPIQNYILECANTLNSSIDYMGCSMMWLASVVIGNSVQVEVKKGWLECSTLWIALVGKAGIGKTPSISNIINPLLWLNNREIKKYIRQRERFEAYEKLDKKQKEYQEEIKEPKKSQFIANDITIEALVDLHQESKNSVGVFKDELAGWFKDMNKYRAGSDLEFWLSSWSGKSVNLNRKTAKSSFVDKPCIPVLGGIQPNIFNLFYTEENKDNGFVDRMLLSYPDLVVNPYSDKDIDQDLLEWFNNSMIKFFDTIKYKVIEFDQDGEIKPNIAYFDNEAKKEWVRIFNEITEIQNSDSENEYMKSMLPKQKTYIPRFALILNAINNLYDNSGDILLISKESMLKAEKLSKYFIAMAKKIKINSIENQDLKKLINNNQNKTIKEKILEVYKENPEFNRVELAEILGISRKTIYKHLKN